DHTESVVTCAPFVVRLWKLVMRLCDIPWSFLIASATALNLDWVRSVPSGTPKSIANHLSRKTFRFYGASNISHDIMAYSSFGIAYIESDQALKKYETNAKLVISRVMRNWLGFAGVERASMAFAIEDIADGFVPGAESDGLFGVGCGRYLRAHQFGKPTKA